MKTTAGVGYTEKSNSYQAGHEATARALKQANCDTCDLAVMFSTEKHHPAEFRNGVRAVIGHTPRLVGGCAMGVITQDSLGYDGFQAAVAVVRSGEFRADVFVRPGLADNEYWTGQALANDILSCPCDGNQSLVLMYDSVKRSAAEGLALNLATPLLQGIESKLQTWPTTVGVGMMGTMQFNPIFQWVDDQVMNQSAIALVLAGNVRMDTVIMHGCRPSSSYHTVTKSEGNTVLEIDNMPALDALEKMLGPNSTVSWEEYPLFITLGVNRGEKFGLFREEDYANRLCMAVDRERRGLVMFGPDLQPGMQVQLMRRSIDFGYMAARVEDLYRKIEGRRPFLAFYIDCAGRASAYCGTEGEEAAEVQRTIGTRMPLLGIYSGVEIAAVGGHVQELDWTGVLCAFSVPE